MIVPGMKASAGANTPMASPSPENLLMAAAEMHRMGKFDQKDKMPTPKAKPKGKLVK